MTKIDKDIHQVITLAGLAPEKITDRVIALADHILKHSDGRIAIAAAWLRQDLKGRGLL